MLLLLAGLFKFRRLETTPECDKGMEIGIDDDFLDTEVTSGV